MRIVRLGLLTAALIFGILIAARAMWGPLSFPVAVRTPINIESICGLCLVLALTLRTGFDLPRPTLKSGWLGPAVGLLALVAAGFWRATHIAFLADDFVLINFANSFHSSTLFQTFTTGGGDGFFRPVGNVALAVSAMWAKFDPRLWHITALVLHGLNSLLVFALASRLGLSRRAAWFGGGLFAIHGCLPESAVWIAGRFDLLATFFVLCGLLAFLGYLRDETSGRWLYGAAGLVCLILALLSKEEAYVFPLLAVLMAFSLRESGRKTRSMLLAFLLVTGVVFVYRWKLLGGIGGYTDLKSGAPLFAELGLLPSVRSLLLRLWAILFFPINWSSPPGMFLGMASAAYVAALIWMAASRTRIALLFPLGMVLVAALPPLHQLLIGPDLQKSRLLYLPLAGFSLMLAAAVDPLDRRARWIVPAVILAFQFTALQHNLSAWERAGEIAQQACTAAARCVLPETTRLSVWNMPGSLDGVYFLDLGLPECVQMQAHSHKLTADFNTGEHPASVQQDTKVLVWDKTSSQLSCDRESNK